MSWEEEILTTVHHCLEGALRERVPEVEQIELCPLSINAVRSVVETVLRRETARHRSMRRDAAVGQLVELHAAAAPSRRRPAVDSEGGGA